MPAGERRIAPLEEEDLGARDVRIHEVDRAPVARAQVDHRALGVVRAADRLADLEEIVEHVEDALRIEVHDARPLRERGRDALDRAEVDRADLAEILGEDHIGREFGEHRLVERVEALARRERRAHLGVDRRARAAVRARAGEDGHRVEPRGRVALVAAPDEEVGEAVASGDGREEFGRGGKQADDAHGRGG